jgi:hypothetical protein
MQTTKIAITADQNVRIFSLRSEVDFHSTRSLADCLICFQRESFQTLFRHSTLWESLVTPGYAELSKCLVNHRTSWTFASRIHNLIVGLMPESRDLLRSPESDLLASFAQILARRRELGVVFC